MQKKTTLEQMTEISIPYTTSRGVKYDLPRPWIGFWRTFREFQIACNELQASNEITPEFLDRYTEFLFVWANGPLLPGQEPKISREQIETDFDVADMQPLARIVRKISGMVDAAVPPEEAAENQTGD